MNSYNHQKWPLLLRSPALLIILVILPIQLEADYFKWELQVFAEGPGTAMQTIPVNGDDPLFQWGKGGFCRISDAWTRMEPELTIEGKTLLCESGEDKKTVSLICRDNRTERRYNRRKELYPEPLTANLLLEESLAHESAYLRFRCYF